MKVLLALFLGMAITTCADASSQSSEGSIIAPAQADEQVPKPWEHGPLQVSADGRFLVQADGTPFFWLGDTGWALVSRYSRAEAEEYLRDRAAKGFNVVLAIALPHVLDLNTANAHGDTALLDGDPTRPNITEGNDPNDRTQYDYWDHIDYVIGLAEQLGIYVAFLPTWGDKVLFKWGPGPVIFNEGNARAYGAFVAERLRGHPNIIWVLGGDREAATEGADYRTVWREMAAGIRQVLGDEALLTYHPGGEQSSSYWLHTDSWLDFNMLQSGHARRDVPVWAMVEYDERLTPAKPVLDAESNYEDHPVNWNAAEGYFRDYDVRKQAYRSVFAGAFGHTYGSPMVWRKFSLGNALSAFEAMFEFSWREAMQRPGATQMIHLRRLMESRPILGRIPDQSLLGANPATPAEHMRATRAADGSYAMVYFPNAGQRVSVDLRLLSGGRVVGWWYDPRTGAAEPIGEFETSGVREFTSPAGGPDWVLVLDDATRGFGPPGRSNAP